jgi:hypothetical protein
MLEKVTIKEAKRDYFNSRKKCSSWIILIIRSEDNFTDQKVHFLCVCQTIILT